MSNVNLFKINFGVHGRGNSFKIFKSKVLPILVDSQIEFDVFNTYTDSKEIYKPIKDFLNQKSVKPVRWRGFVIISDDALLHHVINGLMNRKDWPLAISVPLGMVPGLKGVYIPSNI